MWQRALAFVVAAGVAAEAAEAYDCKTSVLGWWQSWSEEQRAHCCQRMDCARDAAGRLAPPRMALDASFIWSGLPTGTTTTLMPTQMAGTTMGPGEAAAAPAAATTTTGWETTMPAQVLPPPSTPTAAPSPAPSSPSPAPSSPSPAFVPPSLDSIGGYPTPAPTPAPAPAPATTSGPSASAECSTGADKWWEWSHEKQLKCCAIVNCDNQMVQAPSDPYDCREQLATWWSSWSPEKRDWCCTYRVTCPSMPTAPPTTPRTTPPTTPSTTPVPTTTPWDTMPAITAATTSASMIVAPPPPGAAGDGEFDCNAVTMAAWRVLPAERRDWCCATTGIGCSSGNTAPAPAKPYRTVVGEQALMPAYGNQPHMHQQMPQQGPPLYVMHHSDGPLYVMHHHHPFPSMPQPQVQTMVVPQHMLMAPPPGNGFMQKADGRDVHGLLAHAGSAPMVLGLLAGAALAAVAFFVFRARRPSTSAGLSLLRSSTADAPQGMWASE